MIDGMISIVQTYGLLLLVGQYPEGPVGGLAMTLFLAVTGLACAFPLAVLMGIARTAPKRAVRSAAAGFVSAVRGLPVLMLIFWAYFVVPLILGRSVSGVTTVICALVVYETAFLGEVVRGGIEALPKGQVEAARSLGLGYVATLWDVVLPQALYNIAPSIVGQFVNLIKNTSLAYIISVDELTFAASQINAQLLTKPLEVYVILAATYFVVCFSLARCVGLIERRVGKRRILPSLEAAT